MRIGLFGNCQAGAIAQVLAEHLIDDEVVSFKAVHTMNNQDKIDFLDNIKTLDILIHQPISDVYAPVSTSKILDIIGEDNSLIFPVMYFSPYYMDITYLKDMSGKTDRNFISDYHSRTILSSFHYGLNKNDIYDAFNSPDFFPKELILQNYDNSLKTLKDREKSCDINISDFISKNYQNKNLFYTFNHPTGNLLFYVIDSILKKLERDLLSTDSKVKYSKLLGGVHWKSMESVHNSLELNFKKTGDFFIKNKIYSLNDFIDISYLFYKNNEKIVLLNQDRILPKKYFMEMTK